MIFSRTCRSFGLLGLAILAGYSASDARAQQIYRILAPDGKVTFSDVPPLEPNARAKVAPSVPMAGASSDSALPFELRQAASRYPVVLYTGPQCAPCATGREMLTSRGIPFSEKTVSTNEDIDALKRLVGAPTLPALAIGAQQLKGYSEVEWAQFLDAAGYPRTSQLPAGYTPQPASPLVVAQQPQAPARPSAPAQRAPAAVGTATPPPAAENPTGIRF